ncbi:ribonuclease H-like domain-containing protein [Tanacetum coccineum]
MSTIRCLMFGAMKNKWPLWQFDVNNAFLHGDLEEDVYMSLPEGYRCVLSEFGFKQSFNDHSLFVKAIGCVFVALLVYVDDIIISGNDTSKIENIKTFLRSKFQIKDLGKLKYILGIEVINSGNDICLTQRKYCIELLHEFGMLGCKPVYVPTKPNTVLNFKPSEEDPSLVNITGYQKLLGKLIYLIHTRPDISYSVHCLSQHMHAPLKSHLDSAFHVLRYLKGSSGKGLRYVYNPDQYTDEMLAYSDSN